MGWLLVLHLFGVIFWIGSLLLISSLLAMVSDDVAMAKERFILVASRLFFGGCNVGGTIAIVFGTLLMITTPVVLREHWFEAKLILVFMMLLVHIRLHRRIVALEENPSTVTRSEFRAIHGLISALLLAILALAVIKPF